MSNTYQDMLVTDIERIKRAKKVLRNDMSDRKDKTEAIGLLKIYGDLARYYKDSENEDERERAEEIEYELYH